MENVTKLETAPAVLPGSIVRTPSGATVAKVPAIQAEIDAAADAEMRALHEPEAARKLGVRAARALYKRTYLAQLTPRK